MTDTLYLPNARVPWVNKDGTLTTHAVRALSTLFSRAGGAVGDGGDDVFAPFIQQAQSDDQEVYQAPAPVDDVAVIAQPTQREAIAVGGCYFTYDATDPAITLGYGVWAHALPGNFVVGYKSGDPDFGAVGATGGAKSITIDDHDHHTHSVNSTTTAVQSGAGATVVDSVSGSTGNESPTLVHTSSGVSPIVTLPPYEVLYIWKRTA